jgi:muramoyltetrapeptide carboxypeptidase
MIYPPYLDAGDTIGIVAPARKVTYEEIRFAIQWWERKGFRVVLGKHLFSENHQYAGADWERAADLQNMMRNDDVKAIFCARGGYGTMRIIDVIDFLSFNLDPKWICGFSDITVLHSHINKICNVATIHSTMLFPMTDKTELNFESLFQILTGRNIIYKCTPHPLNKQGECSGELVGGNLSLLYALSGSISEIDTTHKILFIEELDEYLYHIDRMMLHLKRAGKLKDLAGLLVGSFTKMRDNEIAFGNTYEQIIREHCQEYGFPIAFNFPAGHDEMNLAMKLGATYSLLVENDKTTLREK